ncbi:hypothetical protein D3C81_1854360 [compost metagenome]
MTIYDSETHSLVANEINRYAIRDIDPLESDEDGSITIFIQNERPSTKVGNWLPAPKDTHFHLIFRAYQPRKEWLTQEYVLPAVVQQNYTVRIS